MESGEEMDRNEDNDEEMDEDLGHEEPRVYLPGQPIDANEQLVCDQSAYIMLHEAQTVASCLSFDIIEDDLGENRELYPLTAYLVAGTQASRSNGNSILVMKVYNLHKTQKENENDEDSDSSEDETDKETAAKLKSVPIRHQGCINRIRTTVLNTNVLAASWSELGRVNIWDLSTQLRALDNEQLSSKYHKDNVSTTTKPLFTFTGHQVEGYGLDWSSAKPGVLATGDCKHDIHIWNPSDGGKWVVDQRPLVGHTESVEDLQWSPNEPNVLASCSIDKSIRIWDTRVAPHKACMLTALNAHERDVNIISWNKTEPFIASGGDDGMIHIWDLRQFKTGAALASFKHHTEPITTIEWHPTEGSVFASGGDDNQIALWDLSLERDTEVLVHDILEVPSQLLFIHQGQKEIKELHWHSQLPGVIISTALSGFNIFRTISV